MDIERFWGLIEQARVTAGPAADQAVRDFDEPDDDPDRDYWDFDDLDLSADPSVQLSSNGATADDALLGYDPQEPAPGPGDVLADDGGDDDDGDEYDGDEEDE